MLHLFSRASKRGQTVLSRIVHAYTSPLETSSLCIPLRFLRSSTVVPTPTSATAAETEERPPIASSKQTRPSKYDHSAILESAERIFDSVLDVTKQPKDDNDTTTAAPIFKHTQLLDEFEETVNLMDKKRQRDPIPVRHYIDEWQADNREQLRPFIQFLYNHGITSPTHQQRIISTLFTHRHGPDLMLQPTLFESRFEAWKEAIATVQQDAQEQEDVLPIDIAEGMLHTWPTMLTITHPSATTIASNLAILKAAFAGDDDDTYEYDQQFDEYQSFHTTPASMVLDVITRFPKILGVPSLELQKRIVKLHLATEGALPRLLHSTPKVLVANIDHILANLRLIRSYSRTGREFQSFLTTNPSILLYPSRKLSTSARHALEALRSVVPPGVDAWHIICAKPQLLLVRGSWMRERWGGLEEAIVSVPAWKEQMGDMIQQAKSWSSSVYASTHPVTTAPSWVTGSSTDPKVLGIGSFITQEPINTHDTIEHEESSNDSSGGLSRRAYSALGEALHMKPWRLQRLEYLKETLSEEEIGKIGFVAALAVTLDQFQQRFPEFEGWVEEKRGWVEEDDHQYYNGNE